MSTKLTATDLGLRLEEEEPLDGRTTGLKVLVVKLTFRSL